MQFQKVKKISVMLSIGGGPRQVDEVFSFA